MKISKVWHRDTKWVNTIGKIMLIDLLDAELSQTFNLKKKAMSAKNNKGKHDWRRCALTSGRQLCRGRGRVNFMYALGFVEIGLSCGSLLFLECSRLSSNIMKNFLLLNFSVSDYHDFEIRAKHFCLSLGICKWLG